MFREDARKYFEDLVLTYPDWKRGNAYYYSKLTRLYKKIIPPQKDILEIGCRDGSLLNALEPARGVGLDANKDFIEIARGEYPHLTFSAIKNGKLITEGRFDYIVICNTIGYVSDLSLLFEQIKLLTKPDTKIIITCANPWTEPVVKLGEILGLKSREGLVNRFYLEDIVNLLDLAGFKTREYGYGLYMPKKIPFISELVNNCIPHIMFLRRFGFVQYVIAQPQTVSETGPAAENMSCSVIIPCYNEESNITECVKRVPAVGSFTEILVVDDGSTDSTRDKVKRIQRDYPDRDIKLIAYSPNRGKGFAVRKGFEEAKGDVLMILDADMTVPPEELPKFFKPLAQQKAQAANGTRMVYLMEKQAMPYLHMFGNKVFSVILSWLMGQRLTDTLCGTKAILKQDYKKMDTGRCPWGDFDILLGIAGLRLKMAEVPVHYLSRKAGSSKMKAFWHGLMLLEMCLYGFKELKLKKLLKERK